MCVENIQVYTPRVQRIVECIVETRVCIVQWSVQYKMCSACVEVHIFNDHFYYIQCLVYCVVEASTLTLSFDHAHRRIEYKIYNNKKLGVYLIIY